MIQRRYSSNHSTRLMGATLGHIAVRFGSYIGFRKELRMSGRFRYDQRLVVLLNNFTASRSTSQLPRNVPAYSKYNVKNHQIIDTLLQNITFIKTSTPVTDSLPYSILLLYIQPYTYCKFIIMFLSTEIICKLFVLNKKLS